MGCGGSKVDDLPLVTLCKKRKEYIKAAADQRYALASSHVSYFGSLKDVGEALCRFVEEELIIGVGSSPPSSPVLTLPSDEGKKKKNNKDSSSSTSLSHSLSFSHHHSPEEDSHIHIDSESDTEVDSSESLKLHGHGSPGGPQPEVSASWPPIDSGGVPYPYSYSAYYMKRSSMAVPSVVYEEPRTSRAAAQWPEYSYSTNSQYGMGGYFGIPMHSPPRDPYYNRPPSPPPATPPPPPPPAVSAWDFLDPFTSADGGFPGYYSRGSYGIRSNTGSPDSNEVREREGIPDLEDENDPKPLKQAEHSKGKKVDEYVKGDSGEGTSRAAAPLQSDDSLSPVQEKEIRSSPETVATKSIEEEENPKRKGVSFEINEASTQDGELGGHVESSKASSLTTLASHGARDLREVVKEIRDEFVNASEYGKEVALLLEVGKLPYRSRRTILKVVSSRILDFITTPTFTISHPPSRRSRQAADSKIKIPTALNGDLEIDSMMKLSSTLEQLYVWEKKLYKEVKDEERLRVIYEKKCKRLKVLDESGAETHKINATQASIRKLLTKIDVAIRAIDAISYRIHKLRDEELQPQLTQLIHGLTGMWRSMLTCHQKQFQAIIESKSRNLTANTSVRRDSSLRATMELELQLLNWCTHFNTWVNTQKAYVESFNGWLMNSLDHKPEETVDGVIPFSPGRAGAPLAFITGNDWFHTMERVSEAGVADAIHGFALSLHRLWERQDEEQRQRLKAEYLTKDFEKRLRTLRKEEIRLRQSQGAALSEKTNVSVVPTESGVLPFDDLKVDLDSMRKRLEEERARHEETIKEVHVAASSSLQAGLIPIFEALGNFVAESLKGYEQIRTENAGDGT